MIEAQINIISTKTHCLLIMTCELVCLQTDAVPNICMLSLLQEERTTHNLIKTIQELKRKEYVQSNMKKPRKSKRGECYDLGCDSSEECCKTVNINFPSYHSLRSANSYWATGFAGNLVLTTFEVWKQWILLNDMFPH